MMDFWTEKELNLIADFGADRMVTVMADGGHRSNSNSGENPEFGVLDDVRTEEPKLYKVIILNDDYSPMDFVVYVLKTFFNHDDVAAQKIMLDVHNKGAGIAGIYSFEVAETKSYQANQFSKQNKYPLKTTIEEDN